ncbi:hypothetical protein MRX96_029887 [Rhipicephalus microplus]
MPSPTGTEAEALQSLYAALPVELISTESPSVAPILVHRDAEGYRTRPSTGKRITWVLTEDLKEAQQWDIPCSVPTLLVVVITLRVVTFTAFFLFFELMNERDAPKEESTTEGEADARGLHLAHLNALERGMVPFESDAQLWLSSRVTPDHRLANEKRERRSSFFRSVLGSLNASGFNGLAILLQDTPESRDESVASVIGVLSRKLRRHNYTLALVLPYTVRGGEAYSDKILALTKILATSDHLFLYPDARIWRTQLSGLLHMRFTFHPAKTKEEEQVPACQTFTRRPFLVSLREACDASEIQAIRKAKQTHLDDIEYACSLWNQSWASRAYRYNTYTCSGQTGIIYQTPEQAQAFYRDLLTQVQSLCYGLVNWDSDYFPSVCLRNKPKLKA